MFIPKFIHTYADALSGEESTPDLFIKNLSLENIQLLDYQDIRGALLLPGEAAYTVTPEGIPYAVRVDGNGQREYMPEYPKNKWKVPIKETCIEWLNHVFSANNYAIYLEFRRREEDLEQSDSPLTKEYGKYVKALRKSKDFSYQKIDRILAAYFMEKKNPSLLLKEVAGILQKTSPQAVTHPIYGRNIVNIVLHDPIYNDLRMAKKNNISAVR